MGDSQYIQVYIKDDVSTAPKKRPPRRNPWGNSSYADLITQAIETSPEKKLTLSQIYDWMIRNIPHFSNQGASNSSAGWKNSIRHNLSLHEKFLRIKNEDTNCKSSYWTVNKSGGTGRTTRRKNLSRRKKSKGACATQRTNASFRKFSVLSSLNRPLSTSSFDSSLQNFSNSPGKKWQSCSSNSSEENESFQSLSESNSPSSVEGEIICRDPYCCNLASFTAFRGNQLHNGFLGDLTSPSSNAYLRLNTDIYNYSDHLHPNGVDNYFYSLGNKFYSDYDTHQNLSTENYLNSIAVEENASTAVSREYFKSPHHLSGSYMTSEYAKVEKIQNSIPDCDKPNFTSYGLNNFPTYILEGSSKVTETFNTDPKNPFMSNESQNLIQLPSDLNKPSEVNGSISLDALNQNQLNNSSPEKRLEKHHSYFKKEVIEESRSDYDYSANFLQNCEEQTADLKFQIYEKENDDVSNFKEITLNHGHEPGNTIQHNYFEKSCCDETIQVQSVLRSISIPEQNYLELQSTDLKDSDKTEIREKEESVTPKDNDVVDNTEQSNGLNSQMPQLKNENGPLLENEFDDSSKESENTHDTIKNQNKFSDISVKALLRSNIKSSKKDSNLHADLCTPVEDVNKKDKSTKKRKSVDRDIGCHHLTCQTSKQQKLESSAIKVKKIEDIVTKVLHVCNDEPMKNSADISNEVKLKMKSLLSHMTNLVLQKLASVSYSKYIGDYTLNMLYDLSERFTPKQLLSILVEFLHALDATFIHQITGIQEFHNYNRSLEFLMRSQCKNFSTLKDTIDFYLRVIPAAISVCFSEKVLRDSRIKDLDIPQDMNLFLRMYKIDAITAITGGERVILKDDLDVFLLEKNHRGFILPSICPVISAKSNSCGFNIVNDLYDIEICNESYYNQEFWEKSLAYYQHSGQDIPQYFLNALELQRTVNQTVADDMLHCKLEDNMDMENFDHNNNPKLSELLILNNQINLLSNQSLPSHFLEAMQFKNKIKRNCSNISDTSEYEIQNNLDEENIFEDNMIPCNSLQKYQLQYANDIKMCDTLPDDLTEIEVLSNFALTDDYLDFELCKNDFDFDNYLKERENFERNRQ